MNFYNDEDSSTSNKIDFAFKKKVKELNPSSASTAVKSDIKS